jgi:hypothetical protein
MVHAAGVTFLAQGRPLCEPGIQDNGNARRPEASEADSSSPIRTSLRRYQSLFPGNGILRGRDSGVEKASHVHPLVSRDKAPTRKPASSALLARHREISVCVGLRGGAERTQTANQTIISR